MPRTLCCGRHRTASADHSPTVDVKIIDADGAELPEAEVGSICIRSPILMTEYWRNPAANAAAMLAGRWLRTEDFGRLQSGLLFLASRVRDLIIRGGENIYPSEVENCLDELPDVLESAVFGRDDDEFGQVVVGAVVVPPGKRAHRRAAASALRCVARVLQGAGLPRATVGAAAA